MNKSDSFCAPIPINDSHNTKNFDCGYDNLNAYLKKFAYINHANGSAKTYVTIKNGHNVVGYYSLAAGAADVEEVPERISKGLARHPIPIILLARLAVDNNEKSKKIGKNLLRDAIVRAIQVADVIGVRAILVHAKDEAAQAFYLQYGFIPSPVDEFHLCVLLKDIKKTLGIQ